MSEILGYDVDGKPLRAGDWVVLTEAPTSKEYGEIRAGDKFCITDLPVDPFWQDGREKVVLHLDMPYGVACATSKLRKISSSQRGTERYTDQFTPADTNFHELLGQISKQGAKA